MKSLWHILYAFSVLSVVLAILLDIHGLYSAAKPLLMITLLLYFLSASKGYPGWRFFVVAALVFSWAGDMFLLSSDMFIAGLASFLVAHVFYIISYHKTGAATGQLKPMDIIKFVVFAGILIGVLYPGLGSLLIPVMAYTLVLVGMGVWAHKRRGATTTASFAMVSAGAMLFVISDGLIAVNKFAFEIPGERILVMSTYMAAQYLIVRGLLKHESE